MTDARFKVGGAMNKREAKRLAYAVAHGLIDGALRDGGMLLDAVQDEHRLADADVARLHEALDDVAQQMWERANPQHAKQPLSSPSAD